MDSVHFEIARCPLDQVERLQQELSIHPVLAQVLVRRGLNDPHSAREFLDGGVEHDPSQFQGMDRITDLIISHLKAGSRITVHGDYDVDGVCSTAVLVRVLRALGADVDWYLPDRSTDGYGLGAETIERLWVRGTRLLITADCAITAVEEVAEAKAKGIEVIVTDHHTPLADGTLPDAPILHPVICGYPCVDLCATAVAHKLAKALCSAQGQQPECIEADLDLVALATLADVVPLLGENRYLLSRGLLALKVTTKPGLLALMSVSGVNPARLDERAVSYALAPRMNAAGRLYHADAALELLLTEDEQRAADVAEELDRANSDRRHAETRILFAAEAQVAELGERPAYVLHGDDWHSGVIGIVASRLAERHQRPVVVLALDEESGKGSARSVASFDLLAALHACTEHLLRYGGHRGAAGLELRRDQIEQFTAIFTAEAQMALEGEDLTPSMRVDAVLSGRELDLDLAESLAALAPFGRSNPKVSLLLPAAKLCEPRPMGKGKHMRFTVASGGARLGAVAFGMGSTLPVQEGSLTDSLFELEVNEWNGIAEPRLNLQHAQACQPDPITLLGEDGSYLERVWEGLGDEPSTREQPASPSQRCICDERSCGIAGTLMRLVASGQPVLVLCADARLRMAHMAATIGGFTLCSYSTLEREPPITADYTHVVLLDPPPNVTAKQLATGGTQDRYVHLLWGEPEIDFAGRILEREHNLRPGLADVYRALRESHSAQGQQLQEILSGVEVEQDRSAAGRPAALASALVRVLSELELIELDRQRRTITLTPPRRTKLEHSATFCRHAEQLAAGRTRLGSLRARAA